MGSLQLRKGCRQFPEPRVSRSKLFLILRSVSHLFETPTMRPSDNELGTTAACQAMYWCSLRT